MEPYIVNAYQNLIQYKDNFNKVAFFSTYQYTDDNSFEEMESLCEKMPIATLRLHRKKEVKVDLYIKKAEAFVDRLNIS